MRGTIHKAGCIRKTKEFWMWSVVRQIVVCMAFQLRTMSTRLPRGRPRGFIYHRKGNHEKTEHFKESVGCIYGCCTHA